MYRRIRALLRRWPDGPPLLGTDTRVADSLDHAPDVGTFLAELAALTEDVAAGWPTDGLAYTLERLMDAISRLPAHPAATPAVQSLYRVC